MKKYSLLIALGTLLLSSSAFGQNVEHETKKYCNLALSAENYGSYCNAVAYYQRVEKEGNPYCHDQAVKTIEQYGVVCGDAAVDESVAVSDNADIGDRYCQSAVSKLVARQYCEAAEDFIKALGRGITDSSCQFKANFVFSEYKDLCHLDLSRIKAAKKYNVNYLCKKADQAKQNNEVCNSYSMYRMAMNETGYSFESCFADAVSVLETYRQKCQPSLQTGDTGTDIKSSEDLCQMAAKAKIKDKDKCKALDYFRKAVNAGELDERCRKIAVANFSMYSTECGVEIPKKLISDGELDHDVVLSNDLCRKALQIGRGSQQEKCESLKYFRKAVDIRGVKTSCYKAAVASFNRYSAECGTEIPAVLALNGDLDSDVVKANSLCQKATDIVSDSGEDDCKALPYYREALDIGGSKAKCYTVALRALERLSDKCAEPNSFVTVEYKDNQTKASEHCKRALEIKIKSKDNCRALDYYRKALATGATDANCTQAALSNIEHSASECDSGAEPSRIGVFQDRSDKYCSQAADAMTGADKDECKALSYYKMALSTRYVKAKCTNEAKTAFDRYLGKCGSADKTVIQADRDNATEYCKNAAEQKSKYNDICTSLYYYKKALSTGGATEVCKKLAAAEISQHSEECKGQMNPNKDVARRKAEEICREAVIARIGPNKNECRALSLYKKALDTRAASASCTKMALRTIEQYSPQCSGELAGRHVTELTELCRKGAEARKNPQEICNSLTYYKNVALFGFADQKCMDDAREVIVQYSAQCRKNIDFPDEDADKYTQEIAENLCKQASVAKYDEKNVCKSLLFYKKALEVFSTDKDCLNDAISTIEQYSGQCRTDLTSSDHAKKDKTRKDGRPRDSQLSLPFDDEYSNGRSDGEREQETSSRIKDDELELPFDYGTPKKGKSKKDDSSKGKKKPSSGRPTDVEMRLPF